MKVFVTGSGSHLAAALLPRLFARPEIERVTGVDIDPPRFQHDRFDPVRLDIRSPRLEDLLAGHDALVHLACVRRQGSLSEREMFDINVNGSHKAFHAARRAGIRRFIHLSSAAVYGSGVHLSEAAPLNPLPQFLYARHQAHLETLLHIEFPDCVRLRPHLILGPNARPGLKRLLRLPFYVRTPVPYSLLQCVHEDDVAQAVLLALDKDVRGPFNLAVEDNFNLREVARRRHRLVLPLPPFAARAGLAAARRWLGWDGELAWIEGLTRTLLLNCRRAAVELGWRSTYNAASVLAQS
jgi:nucleoside-diphosphate-sugar epimerase